MRRRRTTGVRASIVRRDICTGMGSDPAPTVEDVDLR